MEESLPGPNPSAGSKRLKKKTVGKGSMESGETASVCQGGADVPTAAQGRRAIQDETGTGGGKRALDREDISMQRGPQRDCTTRIEAYNVRRALVDVDADHGDRGIELLRHSVLLVFGAPCQLRLLAGQEHGRTILLGDIREELEGTRLATTLMRRCPEHVPAGTRHDPARGGG